MVYSVFLKHSFQENLFQKCGVLFCCKSSIYKVFIEMLLTVAIAVY